METLNHHFAGHAKARAIFSRNFVHRDMRSGAPRFSRSWALLTFPFKPTAKRAREAGHLDRNAQFEHVARRVAASRRGGRSGVSVDTKNKDTLSRKANVGKKYRPNGKPLEVETHDFPYKKVGKPISFGVYYIDSNKAWISVGVRCDADEFAVEAIRRWWKQVGKAAIQSSTTAFDYCGQW